MKKLLDGMMAVSHIFFHRSDTWSTLLDINTFLISCSAEISARWSDPNRPSSISQRLKLAIIRHREAHKEVRMKANLELREELGWRNSLTETYIHM